MSSQTLGKGVYASVAVCFAIWTLRQLKSIWSPIFLSYEQIPLLQMDEPDGSRHRWAFLSIAKSELKLKIHVSRDLLSNPFREFQREICISGHRIHMTHFTSRPSLVFAIPMKKCGSRIRSRRDGGGRHFGM